MELGVRLGVADHISPADIFGFAGGRLRAETGPGTVPRPIRRKHSKAVRAGVMPNVGEEKDVRERGRVLGTAVPRACVIFAVLGVLP